MNDRERKKKGGGEREERVSERESGGAKGERWREVGQGFSKISQTNDFHCGNEFRGSKMLKKSPAALRE